MYNFIDVNEVSESALLPSEALKINGKYIENQIDGYRTLSVTGREALSPDVTSYETGVRDGSRLQSKRYPERIIVVKYQLATKSNEEFREAYNKLGQILDVEEAELIFNDEPDKFFTGTPCVIGAVDGGRNIVTGEFEILCVDPFKYSVVEYTAEPWEEDNTSILIDYNGTYKAFPILEADFHGEEDASEDGETENTLTGSGDCGYVAFFNENEKIIQIGDPDEIDGENAYAKSQTLANHTFTKNNAWGTAAKKLWAVNSGLSLPFSTSQNGTVTMKTASYSTPTEPETTTAQILKTTSRSSAPKMTYTVKAKTSKRTETSVKVDLTITCSLGSDGSYFGNGYSLQASVYIGGSWRNVTLKKTSDYWRGKTAHTANLSVTLSGLSASSASITGVKFKTTRPDGLGQAGIVNEMSCSNIPISKYETAQAESYYLGASGYGSGSGWHGASITRTLGADASGEVGASSFTLTYKQKMCIANGTGGTSQLGAFGAYLFDTNNNVVGGVRVLKNKAGKNASLIMYVNGANVHQTTIDLSYNNKYFGSASKSVKTSTIVKSGKKITFTIGGYKKVFTDDDIASLKVTKIMFMFEQYGTSKTLEYNGLYSAKFVKNNCNTWKDIPNKFSANDVVEADCKNGEIYLNGIPSPELGALGNDWEEFYLTPGLNQIGFSYSEWVVAGYEPHLKVRYREVFL